MAQANFGTMELIGMVSKKWRTRGLTVHQRLKITGFLFLVPALILWLAFHFYPIINTFRLSLYRYDLLTPKRYLGLNNYINLVTDRTFLESCRVTLIYVFGTYVPVFVLSLAVALALSRSIAFRDYSELCFSCLILSRSCRSALSGSSFFIPVG